ncbi:MAG: hypothetical protein AB1650_08235, partial [Candidatus Omnitrophota bacterium]
MDDLKTKIFVLAVIVFSARTFASYIYDPTIYRGGWYTVRTPAGWKRQIEDDEVIFKSPGKDYLGNPEAIFSIYGYQSKGALFMDIFFLRFWKVCRPRMASFCSMAKLKSTSWFQTGYCF